MMMTPPLLPTINATLNFTAGVLAWLGWRAIKRGDKIKHPYFMIAALIVSGLFLCCYIYYHYTKGGMTRYQGQGIMRFLYFSILITHTPLAMLVLPVSLTAVYYAVRQDFVHHVRITKWFFPVWLYVSVTGVLIYVMLYLLPQ